MECMLSCGRPMSTVRMPSLEAMIGPIVAGEGISHTALLILALLTAAGRVVAHDKLLHGDAVLLGDQTQQVRGEGRGGIALQGVSGGHHTVLMRLT